jgi:Tol biopolymer transport system component
MANQYGPWATSIDAGGNPQLSSFWRRRLTMLGPTSQTSPVLSRRNLLWLGAAGALTGILPTLRAAPTQADEEKSAHEQESVSAGRVFLQAYLMTKPKGTDKKETVRGIIAIDPETGRWEKILEGDGVRVSRDGRTLAFSKHKRSNSSYVESAEIGTYDLTTRRASQVVAEGGTVFCWSPDGKRIVNIKGHFTKDDRSQNTTSQIDVDGSGLTKLPIPETDEVDDWSGDGKWFVAVTNRKPPFGCGYQLYRMRPDGTEELRLTEDGLNCYPRFSPDSRQIVYLHQTAKDGNSLHVMDVDGKNDRAILREEGLQSVEAGCFSPDGRRLAVVLFDCHLDKSGKKVRRANDEHGHLEIINIDGTNGRKLPLVGAEVVWLGHPDWR